MKSVGWSKLKLSPVTHRSFISLSRSSTCTYSPYGAAVKQSPVPWKGEKRMPTRSAAPLCQLLVRAHTSRGYAVRQ